MNRFITFSIATLFLSFGSQLFAQLTPGGVQVIFGTATTLGREVRRASTDYKTQKEQKEIDANYEAVVGQADDFFVLNNFEKALEKYTIAAEIKETDHVTQRIAVCRAEIARINRGPYDELLDEGDSLAYYLKFDAAIEKYNAALKLKDEEQAKDRVKAVKKKQALWQSVHLSNLLIADTSVKAQLSTAFVPDQYSDFLVVGYYPKIQDSLEHVSVQSLDGIAIPAGIQLTIYSEPNYKGRVLLDVSGPALINNISRNVSSDIQALQTKEFSGPLEGKFPVSTRSWSSEPMTDWTNGSMKIIAH